MARCPDCGGSELDELEGSGLIYCQDCGDVVEPVDGESEGEDWWMCVECSAQNNAEFDGDACGECGAGRED